MCDTGSEDHTRTLTCTRTPLDMLYICRVACADIETISKSGGALPYSTVRNND